LGEAAGEAQPQEIRNRERPAVWSHQAIAKERRAHQSIRRVAAPREQIVTNLVRQHAAEDTSRELLSGGVGPVCDALARERGRRDQPVDRIDGQLDRPLRRSMPIQEDDRAQTEAA
jgi:hypothetical protein